MTALLSAEGLRHAYGERRVLDGLSFEIQRGEVFGFLGPNGAGKTTTFHILTGLIAAQSGSFRLEGRPLAAGDRDLRSRLGVVFQSPSLDQKLTARENLALGAALYSVPRETAKRRIDEMLAFAELTDRADEKVSRLSGGLKRRLELARALVHQPSILVLDEPTSGLDEASFQRAWQSLEKLRREEGLTVLVTTHRPEEAERCQRLLVLHHGQSVACDTVEGLRRRVSGDVVAVELGEGQDVMAAQRQLRDRFQLMARTAGQTLSVELERGHEWIPRLVEAFPAGAVRSVTLRRPSLADVFLKLTGQELEDDEGEEEGRRMSTAAADLTLQPTARRSPSVLAQELAVIGVLWRRDLLKFLRQPSRLVGALGQPIIFWCVIGSGMASTFRMPGSSVGYMEYFFPGVILMVVVFASIFATVSVIEDRHAGFLLPVLVGPGSRAALVLGRCLGAATVALIQAALFLLLAPWAGFSLAHVAWPLLVGSLALISFALSALGFAIAWWLDNLAGFHAIQMTLLLPLWVVSGAMFPALASQRTFALITRVNPLSYAVGAARTALYGGTLPVGLAASVPAGAGLSMLVLAMFSVVCLASAVAVCVRRR